MLLNRKRSDIASFDKAIAISPNYFVAYYNRGNAYQAKGQYDQAIADFDKAIAINPRFARIYYNKALSYEKAGRASEAVSVYRQFIAIATPQDAQYIEKAKQRIAALR